MEYTGTLCNSGSLSLSCSHSIIWFDHHRVVNTATKVWFWDRGTLCCCCIFPAVIRGHDSLAAVLILSAQIKWNLWSAHMLVLQTTRGCCALSWISYWSANEMDPNQSSDLCLVSFLTRAVCGFPASPLCPGSLCLIQPRSMMMSCSFSTQSVPRCCWTAVIHFPSRPFHNT